MTFIRAFIAIDLPDEVKRTVTTVQEQLTALSADGAVRWAKPNAMHLTLRFLGQTNEALLPSIGQAMDTALSIVPSFPLVVGNLNVFPNRNRPRVVVFDLSGGPTANSEPLLQLRAYLDAALEASGIEPEKKPFNPHITLGRVRKGRKLAPLPTDIDVPHVAFMVTAIHLIESDLRPGGPIYTTRHSTDLAPDYPSMI